MSLDKPWNDVADQLRPARPDLEDESGRGPDTEPIDVVEADPADVADQRRIVPLPDESADDQF
ncbi:MULTISPECIES: hypothetical protein [Actinomycetes]|uniref:hypothetical protein n=1 Tax=Actinomycetes TaxID=1760 RepID=UPI0018948F13|nr:hypothetical protein [Nocardia farcinica]MBF6253994.1 hypothetical protein [Nocardia farcinica]MBF6265531.1 hypothetical protein [Nocardia farcinica]MBF6284132.1 hypothetical protein [Nocardia farcinica]MBF6308166.1 hypothetical protein [Nocardia farcinica]MBF6511589.1 hypothetical protein [Nocardia farcinica]